MDESNIVSSISGSNKPEDGAATAVGPKSSAQSSVITVYKAKIAGLPRHVTVIWAKTIINHSLSVSIDNPAGESPSTCKIDLKPWPFWGKKGFKTLDIGDRQIDLFWDLRAAKFAAAGGPEPAGGYYVALVVADEVILLIGDLKKKAFKRTKARPSLDDAVMVSKRDNVFGKRCFPTRARFDGGKREHEIVVENSKDAEMWICIDGVVMIHVSNLRWKFRGNETVMVESSPVDVFWDVHDWLFGGAGMGGAFFIFKPAPATATAPATAPATVAATATVAAPATAALTVTAAGDGGEMSCLCEGDAWNDDGGGSPEFCFFLYAWKVE